MIVHCRLTVVISTCISVSKAANTDLTLIFGYSPCTVRNNRKLTYCALCMFQELPSTHVIWSRPTVCNAKIYITFGNPIN